MIGINYDDPNILFGNHMFQYSLCRLISLKNGYNFHIKHGNHLLECFPNIDLGSCDGEMQRSYEENIHSQAYLPDVFNIPDFTNLLGCYQTSKYFNGNENLVKSWFPVTMEDSVRVVLDKYPVDDFCYVHMRGCDYKANNWNLPRQYYLDAMEEVKKIKPDIKFVIVTDDLEMAKLYFPDIDVISTEVHEYGFFGRDGIIDFKSLYYSKYCIIANSTFSWWAAWLSDKVITVAPNNWLNYNKPESGFYPFDIKTDGFIYI